MSAETGRSGPRSQLTLLDATSLIVGTVIGAGIYETAPEIARQAGGLVVFLLLWLAGGIVTLAGALCYAELASACPGEGGDYRYLSRAFGRGTGFLFSWMMFWVVRPANIGALAFIFAHYADIVAPLGGGDGRLVYAVAAVIMLTLVNALGVRRGKLTQNLLTLIKVVGILAVCGVGFAALFAPADPVTPPVSAHDNDLALAMILVLFTYGGWRNISFVAGEVIDPGRNLTRALLFGSAAVTAIYVLVNLAFLAALGWDGVLASDSIATDSVRPLLGTAGALAISLLIALNCLGAINGMIFTDSRIYYAMGREHRTYAWLGRWDQRLDSPFRALLLQAAVTLTLVLAVGRDAEAFSRLVVYSAPAYWLFSVLVGLSLFRLRREPGAPRPGFRVPAYPWVPILFVLSTLFMGWASLSYAVDRARPEAWAILFIFVAGLVAARFDAMRGRRLNPRRTR